MVRGMGVRCRGLEVGGGQEDRAHPVRLASVARIVPEPIVSAKRARAAGTGRCRYWPRLGMGVAVVRLKLPVAGFAKSGLALRFAEEAVAAYDWNAERDCRRCVYLRV